jgi:4-amino-4-deoxy-L-arabinose transferase-like glycosyltransferase
MKLKNLAPVILLVFLSSFLFIYGLGGASLFETDEYIYTQIAKEIVKIGDFVTLHFMGKPWFIHPPLYMWLTAATGAFFGFSETVARIWCAIFGVIGVIFTYLLGKELFSRRAGFIAGVILATTMQYIIQSRIAVFDPPLVALMLAAVYFFHMGRIHEEKRYFLLFFASMAFAVLMKGPVGLVLPLIVIVTYLIFSGEFRLLFRLNWIKGVLLFLLITSPWYIAEWAIHGKKFMDTMFGFYTFGRFLRPIETHAGPWYYYFIIIPVGFLPWTAFLPAIIGKLLKDRKERNCLFVILWFLIVFVFFSVARTKLPGYVLSIYPFLALGLGYFFDSYMSNPRESFNRSWIPFIYTTPSYIYCAYNFAFFSIEYASGQRLRDAPYGLSPASPHDRDGRAYCKRFIPFYGKKDQHPDLHSGRFNGRISRSFCPFGDPRDRRI